MSEAIKPTKGEWRFYTEPQPNGCPIVGNDKGLMVAMVAHSVNYPDQKETALGDALLIVEAGTVFHETKCTPRQLVEQRDALVERVKELEEALRTLHTRLSDCSDIGAQAHEAYDSFYRGLVEDVLSKSLPNTIAEVKE